MIPWLAAAALAGTPVEQSLADYVTATCDVVGVEVRYLGVEAAGTSLIWSGDACRPRPTLRLQIDGRPPLTVRPVLTIRVAVPVAAEAAKAGEIVTTEPGEVELPLRGRPVEGRWLARTAFAAGDMVTEGGVSAIPDARAGDAVTVQVSRGSLVVAAPGRLLQDAQVGDRVGVQNQATHATVHGVLVDPVTIEIGGLP